MFLSAMIISGMGDYYLAMPCDKVEALIGGRNKTLASYPECAAYYSGANPRQHASVQGDLGGPDGHVERAAAALDLNFGAAWWLSLAMHAVGVEIYVSDASLRGCVNERSWLTLRQLHLTPRETERLRNVSYQKQLEAGMKMPGRGGLTADRLGDSENWVPKAQHQHDSLASKE